MQQMIKKEILKQTKNLIKDMNVIITFILISFFIATNQREWINALLIVGACIEVIKIVLCIKKNENDDVIIKKAILGGIRFSFIVAYITGIELLWNAMFYITIDNWYILFLFVSIGMISMGYAINITLEKMQQDENSKYDIQMETLLNVQEKEQQKQIEKILMEHLYLSTDKKMRLHIFVKNERILIEKLRNQNISLYIALESYQRLVNHSLFGIEHEIVRSANWTVFPTYRQKEHVYNDKQ